MGGDLPRLHRNKEWCRGFSIILEDKAQRLVHDPPRIGRRVGLFVSGLEPQQVAKVALSAFERLRLGLAYAFEDRVLQRGELLVVHGP